MTAKPFVRLLVLSLALAATTAHAAPPPSAVSLPAGVPRRPFVPAPGTPHAPLAFAPNRVLVIPMPGTPLAVDAAGRAGTRDVRLRAALDRLAADVKRIPVELADAREKLWTPEKEKPENSAKLWTPGSKQPA